MGTDRSEEHPPISLLLHNPPRLNETRNNIAALFVVVLNIFSVVLRLLVATMLFVHFVTVVSDRGSGPGAPGPLGLDHSGLGATAPGDHKSI